MTEVDIHYNLSDKAGYACRLLRKMAGRGAKAVVLGAQQQLEQLDRLLWTFSAQDFVPHCRSNAPAHMLLASTVVLAETAPAINAESPAEPILVNLGLEVPAGFEKHQRLIDLVGQDEAERTQGRLRWKFYKERGYPIRAHDRAHPEDS